MENRQVQTRPRSLTASPDPTQQNSIVSAVQRIRTLQDDLTPRQRAVRDAGRQQVAALMASVHYSLAPRA